MAKHLKKTKRRAVRNATSKSSEEVLKKGSKKELFKKKKPRKSSGKCFVLMPFREPFDSYYEGIIKPAVKAAHLEPLRGDSLFRPTPIMADVWEMIQETRVLLAELTTKNANVFYELGLAHAIGKPVVLISETMEDVPFDLQPLRVILYSKDNPVWGNKLRDTITSSLEETLTDPSAAVPAMFRKIVKSQAPEDSGTNQRIDEMERRIAAFVSSPTKVHGPRHEAVERLENELRHAGSRERAIAAAREGVMSGMPLHVVERALMRFLPSGESDRIMREIVRQL